MEEATGCPSCGYANRAGKRFCGGCGKALPSICPACGANSPRGARFCDECGSPLTGGAELQPPVSSASPGAPPASLAPAPSTSPLPASQPVTPSPAPPPQEERRLVTALFCDLVGFTPLSESLDPEDARDIQADYFGAMSQQIERYGGVVEKYAGDAVLALFGAPIAHEDDAERAVLCALGMQAAIEPVVATARARWQVEPAIRIGINTGEVVSGTWTASGRQDVAVTGDAVNTAARLQATAEPGEVLTGTETMRLTRRRIRYGGRRDVVLKGKWGSVAVYPALGPRERSGERWETSEGATPLIGRDREFQALLDDWMRAQGGDGQLVTVIGDAGVGKSRLLAELIETVAATTAVRVVRARCLSYGQGIALWLIADLLRSLFGLGEADGPADIRTTLGVALPALLVHCDVETQVEALDVLGEVLGLPPGTSLVGQASAQIRRQALIRSLKGVLGALSERAATTLVLEDLHRVDAASSEVLKEMLADVPGLRLLVLVAQRPGWSAPWSEWGWTERITLRPLGDSDAALLAGAVLGGMPLSPPLVAYVAERAGGNPFFVEELLRALQETGGVAARDGQVVLVPGVAERLPSTLTEVLLARLDRLEGPVKGVAQVASVIGRSFGVRLLAQVMEQAVTALELPLSSLQQAEIAFPRRGVDLEYVFKHVTMREVAYHTLIQKRRQHLHLQTARAIAALYPTDEYVEIIAYHYARTQEHAEAGVWLERAGDRAAAIYAMETASADYREARTRQELVGGAASVLARLDEKLGEVFFTVGRYGEAIPVLERAVELYREHRDLEGAGRAASWLGRALGQDGRSQEGLSRVEPLVELLTWNGPSPALASLQLALTSLFQNLGRYAEMLVAAERAAEIATAIGDERLLAAGMGRRGTALNLLGRSDEARQVLADAIPLLERVGDLGNLTRGLGSLGEAHRLLGELENARRSNERSLEVAERIGNFAMVAFSLMNLGQILLTLGEWEEAQAQLVRAEEVLATLSSTSQAVSYVPAILGQVFLVLGNWVEAEAAFQRALGIAEAREDRQALEIIHGVLAEFEVLRGEPELAITRLGPLAGREGGYRVLIETVLAWALLEAGKETRAGALAGETVARARELGEVLALVDALRVQGMVLARRGQADEAATSLEEGLALARSLPYPYAEARILAEMGGPEEALVIFQRLGASKDIAWTQQALAELGRA